MELALSDDDVRRIVASGKMAVLLGIEFGFDQVGSSTQYYGVEHRNHDKFRNIKPVKRRLARGESTD